MTRNVGASVHQRLLNAAKRSHRRFNDLLQLYALERWLFRLSRSSYADRFVLKGALLLMAWDTPTTRPTRDIDLLGRIANDLDLVRSVIAEICQTRVDDDGLIFDPRSVTTDRIAEDADYQGVRARFLGRLGNARINVQVDIGFSDVVTPSPSRVRYPTMLDQPAAELLAYNRETTIAEKFEAIVKLGQLNSRMKDFFDIWLLASVFPFDGDDLGDAIRATFARRQTPIEAAPVGFSSEFACDPSKAVHWKAFVRRSLLHEAPEEFSEVVEHVRQFVQPVAAAIVSNRTFAANWTPGGPWSPKKPSFG